MTHPVDLSANEVETLVYKAARGGGMPLGHAEDLAAATRFMDLDRLTACPCSNANPAVAIQTALDQVCAGAGPQTVTGDAALIEAYVAAAQIAWGRSLVYTLTPTGAVFDRFTDQEPDPIATLGRRSLSVQLRAHLTDMASKILVPETEASRNAGAGAGLTDND